MGLMEVQAEVKHSHILKSSVEYSKPHVGGESRLPAQADLPLLT